MSREEIAVASFERLRSFLTLLQDGIEEDATKGILRFSPTQLEEGGRILFETLESGGFATFVVPGKSGWDPESDYYKDLRKQARLGKNITRLFLLPHRHYLREKLLQKHYELDTAAGIKVKFAIVDGLSIELSLLHEVLDFGIWDEELVCWVYKQSSSTVNAAGYWTITNRREDLDLARRIRDTLLEQDIVSATPASFRDEFALEEPLTKSAPVMSALAEFLCKGDHLNREDCAWYHRVWQYLRLLDLVSTPTWHSSFYLSALSEGTRNGQIREVLISGAADYSTLAYILHIHERIGVKCNVTFLDLCETPLMIARWYAATKGAVIKTVKEDILKFESPRPFDYIVTDAFLTRFSPRDRKKVLLKWKALLRRGGRVVTTVRLNSSANPNEPKKATPSEIDNFVYRTTRLAELWRDFVLLEPEEIGRLAYNYAEQMESYPIWGRQELEAMFEEAGFQLVRYQEAMTKGEMKSTMYAEIVARIA
jgi:ubiquinone/menaquinone biosynthesis C-methylase UbiE